MIGPGDDASVRWLAEIDAGRVTEIVQRIVRAPSLQTERFPDATHTVQDEVRIVVDRRLLPGQDHAAAFADIARAIRSSGTRTRNWCRWPTSSPAPVPSPTPPSGI